MRILSILILSFFTSQAMAGPGCPSLHRDLQSDANLHLATIIGEENRETFPDYAKRKGLELKSLEKKYSATGVFHCGGYSGTANVVHKNNRLVLSAHQFFEEKSCTKKMGGNFSSCYFEVTPKDSTEPVKYKLNLKTLALGSQCPMGYASDDWAVVDLEREVKGITPYRVADVSQLASADNAYEGLIGQNITTIARRNENFNGHPLQTSSLCDGEIGGSQAVSSQYSKGKDHFIATNCSFGGGNSGGGVFLQSGDTPTLIGVAAKGIGTDYQPFGAENYSGAALVEGRLYKAVTK